MFNNPHMSVMVSGGTNEENSQLVSAIHQSLYNNGFMNASISQNNDIQNMPMLAQIRIINPELFDTKIVISSNNITPMPAVINNVQNNFELPQQMPFPSNWQFI